MASSDVFTWKCENKDCSEYNKEDIQLTETMSYNEELDRVMSSHELCPKCSKPRLNKEKGRIGK